MQKIFVWLLKFASILWLLFVWRYGVKSAFDAWMFIGALMFYTTLWLIVLRVRTDSVRQVLGGVFYFPQFLYFLLAVVIGYKNHLFEVAILVSFYILFWYLGNKLVSVSDQT